MKTLIFQRILEIDNRYRYEFSTAQVPGTFILNVDIKYADILFLE